MESRILSQPQFSAESCQETAGFLFSHPCGEMAAFTCSECQKPVCQRHAIDHGGLLRCVSCMKKLRAAGDSTTSDIGSPYGAYPPYFYGDHYGYGYGYGRSRYGWTRSHHDHDFTDSDEMSVSGGEETAEGVAKFENNLGAS